MKTYPKVELLKERVAYENRIAEIQEKMAQLAIELLYWQTELGRLREPTSSPTTTPHGPV